MCLGILLAALWCGALQAAPANAPLAEEPAATRVQTPGVEAAQAVSTLTGVAISPLLGVGAVGAWKYARTPQAKRPQLPWFAQPWFWGPALGLVFLVFLKDVLGTSVPTVLKKPFDVLELFENKVSGLIAAGAFVPIVASIFRSAGEEAQLASWGLGSVSLAPLGNLLALPLALAAFVIVFLAGHAVNVLILISPFATLDAALKSFRLFLIGTVAATSMANPYVGAAWALAIILVSYFIAGWSLRMSVFGSVFAWDFLTWRHRRIAPGAAAPWVFTARRIGKAPVRTLGRLSLEPDGRLLLRYRPWLVLPERVLTLPSGQCFVGRGLLFPEIRQMEGGMERAQLSLPPRYRTHEEAIARQFRLAGVQDIGLRRGTKAVWQWLKNLFGRRQPEPAAV